MPNGNTQAIDWPQREMEEKAMLLTRFVNVAVITSVCWCAGCGDSIHGVSRIIPLDTLPSPEAIEQAIRATPGVTDVTRRDFPPRDIRTLYKTVHEASYAQFSCMGEGSAFATIETRESSDTGNLL